MRNQHKKKSPHQSNQHLPSSDTGTNRKRPAGIVQTLEHRRFVEFCDACRRYRYIGLCYGPPGVGKTMSARAYAQWERLEALDARFGSGLPPAPEILACRTVLYTPPVANTPRRIDEDVHGLRLLLTDLIQAMPQVLAGQTYGLAPLATDVTELII